MKCSQPKILRDISRNSAHRFWWSESDKCTNNKALIFPLLLLAADHNHCRDGRWAKILVWTYGDKFVVLVVVLSASVIWCLVEVKFTSCCGLPVSPRFRDPKSIVNKRRCASLWLVLNFECVLVKKSVSFSQNIVYLTGLSIISSAHSSDTRFFGIFQMKNPAAFTTKGVVSPFTSLLVMSWSAQLLPPQ